VAGEEHDRYDGMRGSDKVPGPRRYPGCEWGANGVLEILVMKHRRVASSLALACLAVLTSHSLRAEPKSVIELFTSQGCSSCPPADELAGKLAQDPSILMMTLAVDYWDYLGWKDTLALTGHTNRQRAYARARGDREVYTPQVVVNGMLHALGSDKSAIERAIRKSKEIAAPMTLNVTTTIDGDTLTVHVPAAKDGVGQGEVWLCPISKKVTVAIGRGENNGRSVTYTNVARRWIKVGDWSGKAETFTVALKSFTGEAIDTAAVVVQHGAAGSPKAMLGAAQFALR